ncbi:MAG: rRNA maturation RNase YbeY [Solirubrobacteraceae bacterium]
MLEVEVIGIDAVGPTGPTAVEIERLCARALSSVGIADGHLAVELVEEDRMRELNREHRRRDVATDVLSFGIDENDACAGPRELGDIVICPERTIDLREAVLHGALHLSGMDHEVDGGEMLALQAELMRRVR